MMDDIKTLVGLLWIGACLGATAALCVFTYDLVLGWLS